MRAWVALFYLQQYIQQLLQTLFFYIDSGLTISQMMELRKKNMTVAKLLLQL